jgi:hypothetical protein
VDSEARREFKPRQRDHNPQRVRKDQAVDGGGDVRLRQRKEDLHNPEVHRQTVPLQQAEIRHSLLHAAGSTGTFSLIQNGSTKGYWYN